jgi:hypothetical protein
MHTTELPMIAWKQATQTGNLLFSEQNFQEALHHYRRALALAITLFADWNDADEAVATLVVSHHNVAALLLQANNTDEAARILCGIHTCLQRAVGNERMSLPLRQAAQRHSRETYTELRLFAKRFDRNPEVKHALRTGCDMRCLDGVSTLH